MWLLIDDTRNLGCDVIARTAEAARTLLGGVGYAFDGVYLDHDLGDGDTGYDVLKWAIEGKTLPPIVHLITMNPVGRENMARLLASSGYETTDGVTFQLK